jgi:hypothetical protein
MDRHAPATRAVMAIGAYIVICAPISVASAAALRDRTTEDIDIDTQEVATTSAAVARLDGGSQLEGCGRQWTFDDRDARHISRTRS